MSSLNSLLNASQTKIQKRRRILIILIYKFANFIEDSTDDHHRACICCLLNGDSSIKKSFSSEDYVDQLLEFIPYKSLIYFHYLGYDCKFLAKYGATGKCI